MRYNPDSGKYESKGKPKGYKKNEKKKENLLKYRRKVV